MLGIEGVTMKIRMEWMDPRYVLKDEMTGHTDAVDV